MKVHKEIPRSASFYIQAASFGVHGFFLSSSSRQLFCLAVLSCSLAKFCFDTARRTGYRGIYTFILVVYQSCPLQFTIPSYLVQEYIKVVVSLALGVFLGLRESLG